MSVQKIVMPDMLLKKVTEVPIQVKWTFFMTVIAGMLAHGFVLTNKLPNFDELLNIRLSGGGLEMGRWLVGGFAPIISKLAGNYTNPWIIGTISIILIAFAACFIVEALEIKSIVAASMVGAILISFPTITGMFLFMFGAYYFALAIFMVACAVWIGTSQKKRPIIVGGEF